jgi:hypothetical protein
MAFNDGVQAERSTEYDVRFLRELPGTNKDNVSLWK